MDDVSKKTKKNCWWDRKLIIIITHWLVVLALLPLWALTLLWLNRFGNVLSHMTNLFFPSVSLPPFPLSLLSFSVSFSTSILLFICQQYDRWTWNLYVHCPLLAGRMRPTWACLLLPIVVLIASSALKLFGLSTPFQYHQRSQAVVCCKKRNASSQQHMEYLLGEAIHMCGLQRSPCTSCSMVIVWSRQWKNPDQFSGRWFQATGKPFCFVGQMHLWMEG